MSSSRTLDRALYCFCFSERELLVAPSAISKQTVSSLSLAFLIVSGVCCGKALPGWACTIPEGEVIETSLSMLLVFRISEVDFLAGFEELV